MTLPFTIDQFLGVFKEYNLTIWPLQVIAYVLGLAAVALAFSKKDKHARVISAALAVFWLWNGAMYHITHFAQINKAAYVFGFLFIIQGILFLTYGTLKNKMSFSPELNLPTVLGSGFIIYSAVIYPVIGYVLGHGYPNSPLLGVAPCPTTIFTFGMLLFAKNSIPLRVCWVPLLWSLIGFNASWALGIREDVGLLVAGLTSVALIVYKKYKYKQEGSKQVVVEKVVV